VVIELGRTYHDGYDREVRIIATDAKRPSTPIIGLVETPSGDELIEAYREDGVVYPMSDSKRNLIIPRRFIDLEAAVAIINASGFKDEMAEGLRGLPFKEIDNGIQ
jgi:hypothetical protein